MSGAFKAFEASKATNLGEAFTDRRRELDVAGTDGVWLYIGWRLSTAMTQLGNEQTPMGSRSLDDPGEVWSVVLIDLLRTCAKGDRIKWDKRRSVGETSVTYVVDDGVPCCFEVSTMNKNVAGHDDADLAWQMSSSRKP